MEAFSHAQTTSRARGNDIPGGSRRGGHRNKQWVAGETNGGARNGHGESERWERASYRGGGRGIRGAPRGLPTSRKFPNATLRVNRPTPSVFGANGNTSVSERDQQHESHEVDEEEDVYEVEDHPSDTPEERERFYQEVRIPHRVGRFTYFLYSSSKRVKWNENVPSLKAKWTIR